MNTDGAVVEPDQWERAYRKHVGLLQYVANDRFDLKCSVKEVRRDAARPTKVDRRNVFAQSAFESRHRTHAEREQPLRKAGYDCSNNATVLGKQGRLLKQCQRVHKPRSCGVGTPRVTEPRFGDCGSVVTRHRAMVDRTEGDDPRTDQVTKGMTQTPGWQPEETASL